ncbi:MAG: acetate--CoA ligase family protein [Candidatus Hydrogenedentota bacterium]
MSTSSLNVAEILQEAIDRGDEALSELAAKQVLAAYGVPVTAEELAADAGQGVAAAERLGYPVALKPCGAAITHKSERNLVRLGLADAAAVQQAAQELVNAMGDTPFDGLLVQPMVRGKRELIVGGLRDATFGPCVMLGMGGIAVEATGDVAFRLAPVSPRDVAEMIGELHARKVFDAFRGDGPVDREALATVVMGVGQLLLDHPEVAQVDVNPLIVEGEHPIAVDALITLSPVSGRASVPASLEPGRARVAPGRTAQFRALFEPESVAIIGVSDSPLKWGFRILFNTVEGGYQGRLYGVNPKYGEVIGVPCFPGIEALPEVVDLAIVVVPPPAVCDTLRQCVAKGIGTLLVITAGFGELEDANAQAAQDEMAAIAKESGALIIGPNCAGVVSPAPHQLYCGMISRFPGAGGLSLVSQSGNVGSSLLTWAGLHHVGIGRFISTGNEAATRNEDYLAFFAEDEKTRSIISYVEGTHDGRRLYAAMQHAAVQKPVVLVKGGRSTAGNKAAASHTGSLAGETRIFRAACRQAGVTMVDDMYEAMEVAGVFMQQPLPKGRRVVIVSQGGGWGVMAADACAEAGLDVIPLPEAAMAELDTFLPGWWSRNNPIDLVASNDLKALGRAVETVIKQPEVDGVILLGVGYIDSARERYAHSERAAQHGMDAMAAAGAAIELEEATRMASFIETYQKPLLVASDTALLAYGPTPNEVIREFEQRGVYVFDSPTLVAHAMAHMARRYAFLHP